jgi:hypothetical protein
MSIFSKIRGKFSPARLASEFNPKKLTNLAAWFDASDSDTITLNGSDVSQWDDKSGNQNNASQTTYANQPSYETDTGSFNKFIRFDGTTEYLTLTDAIVVGSIYAAIRLNETDNRHRAIFGAKSNDSGDHDAYYFKPNDSSYKIASVLGGMNAEVKASRITNTPYLYGSTHDRAGGTVKLNVNGIQRASSTLSGTALNVDGPTVVGAAYHRNKVVDFLNGDIAELVVYDRVLTAEEENSVENYMMAKWGISSG